MQTKQSVKNDVEKETKNVTHVVEEESKLEDEMKEINENHLGRDDQVQNRYQSLLRSLRREYSAHQATIQSQNAIILQGEKELKEALRVISQLKLELEQAWLVEEKKSDCNLILGD